MIDRPLLVRAFAVLRTGAGVALLGAVVTGGCARPDDLQEVALRLGPADFARPATAAHAPVVQIGDEARPVIEQPTTILVSDQHAVPIVDGVARIDAKLPAAAAALDDGAFVLTVRRDLVSETDEIAIGAAMLHFVRRDEGWRLRRDVRDPNRITVEVDEPGAPAGTTLQVRLHAMAPVATRLLSSEFEVPPRARLVLGYGIGNPPRDAALGDSRFSARLECAGRAAESLLDERIAAGDERATRWQSAFAELPARGARCRLQLETSGAAAALGSGVWAVPEVLSRADRSARERRNVVLISLDTLRADHLSVYGYPRATSPQIDRQLAARGTRFSDVSTTFPLTSIAHMSLMTGLFSGAMPRPGSLDPWTPARLVAEALREAGYTTGAFTEDALLAGMYGFWFGFDRFVERPLVGEARGTETFADGARFLREHRDQRFFLFLHTYKVHAPYSYSPPYGELFGDAAQWSGALAPYAVPPEQHGQVDAYDRAIREVDDQVAGFLSELDRLGLAKDTYVVLLSDHGEAFGEHGLVGHGMGGHQEQLHIPLLVRGPGVPRGATIDAPASIVDVAPTILDLLGLEAADMQGRSLRPALDGAPPAQDRALLFSWLQNDAQGLRQGHWKLLDGGPAHVSLFDLVTDPGERQPIGDPALLAPRSAALALAADDDRQRKAALAAAGPSAEPSAPSERQRESLRALGYVQ